MSTQIAVARFQQHGDPVKVVATEEEDVPSPAAGEVFIDMLAAPINPVDLNVIEGKYPVRPALPGVPGSEGVGVVRALGADVSGVEPGQHVILPHSVGSWRNACVARAEKLVAVPPETPVEQAAMLRINPPTAWRMLHDFVRLEPGEWFIQNAANSGVGRAAIQIGHALGLRSVNVVRRAELIEELKAEGADVVLLEGDELPARAREATGGAAISLALNGVGGESALNLANSLAAHGTIVTYGAMSRQPLRIPNGLLIFKDIRWRGFWITKWYDQTGRTEWDEMFAALVPLVVRGRVRAQVERTYPLREVKAAIEHAQREGRSGKVLLDLRAG